MAGQVALEWIEYVGTDGKPGRIAPGSELPSSLSADDIKALKAGGAIGTAKEHADRVATADADANRERIRREAEAAGFKVTG